MTSCIGRWCPGCDTKLLIWERPYEAFVQPWWACPRCSWKGSEAALVGYDLAELGIEMPDFIITDEASSFDGTELPF